MSAIDDPEADIKNLKVLVDVTTGMMIDCDYHDHNQMVADGERNVALIWIIRDLVDALVVRTSAYHHRSMDDAEARKAVCQVTRLIPPDAIDQLHQIRDELRTIWLAMGNTTDLEDDGVLTPVREALNGSTNRLDDVCKAIDGEGSAV